MSKPPSPALRARGLMLLAVVLWPMLEFTGVSLMPRHHALQVVFMRYAAHLVVLLAVLLPGRGVRDFRTTRPVMQLLRGMLMFGMPASYVLASSHAGNRWIWSVFWSLPLTALAISALLLKERPRWFEWAAALFGFVGAVLINGGPAGGPVGTFFALLMGGSMAGYLAVSRLLRGGSLATSLLYTAVGAMLPTAAVVWKVWTPLVAADIAPTLIVGALSVAILGILDRAVETDVLASSVPLLALVPVLESGLLAAAGRSVPGPADALGATVVMIGMALLFAGSDATWKKTRVEAARR